MEVARLKIGDLARLAGCGVETVRHYEREGLLPRVARTAGNYRLYGEAHLQRLRFIRRCRALGMSQDEVRTLLDLQSRPADNCEAVDACVTAHIEHVSQRIAELQLLLQELQAVRAHCGRPDVVAQCGILDALQTDQPGSADVATAHPGAKDGCCA
ncbi:MAG: Cd(II)/Pb(II)-responsive transcriptional regulator [Rhodocyclaceae bacterium]